MPATDEQVIHQRNDLEMLKRPHLWRYHNGARCVFLKDRGRDRTGPCFLTRELTPTPGKTFTVIAFYWQSDKPLEPVVRQYDSAEDVLADGWVVD